MSSDWTVERMTALLLNLKSFREHALTDVDRHTEQGKAQLDPVGAAIVVVEDKRNARSAERQREHALAAMRNRDSQHMQTMGMGRGGRR